MLHVVVALVLLYCLIRSPGTVLLLAVLGVTRLNLALPVLAALYRFIDRGQQTRHSERLCE
jgi:hypothetical protein